MILQFDGGVRQWTTSEDVAYVSACCTNILFSDIYPPDTLLFDIALAKQVCWKLWHLIACCKSPGPFSGSDDYSGAKHKIGLAILSSDHKHLLFEQPLLQWAAYLTLWVSVSSSVKQESHIHPQGYQMRTLMSSTWHRITGQLLLPFLALTMAFPTDGWGTEVDISVRCPTAVRHGDTWMLI